MNYQQSMRALAQAQNDALIAPMFFIEAVEDPIASKAQGRPIYKDEEFVRIKFAGDKTREHVAPAHEAFRRDKATNEWVTYAQEYAPIYAKFKDGLQDQSTGTPLSEATFLSAAKRSELKALNVASIEALAALDGAPLKRLGMGGRDLKNQAMAYLEKANGTADVVRMSAENAALKEQMAEMQRQMTELIAAQKVKSAPAEEAGDNGEPTPFDDYSDEDVQNWLKGSGFAFDKRWSRKTLIAKAVEANEELKKKKAA